MKFGACALGNLISDFSFLSECGIGELTLIITELSPFGIAMAADTAETVTGVNIRGSIEDRAFFGLTKLLPIQKLQAGISYWGWATMPPDKGIWMDWWLRVFLTKKTNNYNTIEELAKLLEKELRKIVPPLNKNEMQLMPQGSGGVHLAGFVDEKGKKTPCFWHIHNGMSQALPEKRLDPSIVNANYDCPPQKFLQVAKMGAIYSTTNGDIEVYARFFRKYLTNYLRELRKEMEIVVPLPTLGFRAEFLRAQIRFISELYAVGGIREEGTLRQMVRGIGGEVTTLTITEDGIQSYQTR